MNTFDHVYKNVNQAFEKMLNKRLEDVKYVQKIINQEFGNWI